MRSLRGLAVAFGILSLAPSASAQPVGPPLVLPSDPAARQAFEEQRSAYLAYQKCVADHEPEYRLYSAAQQVIQVRDNRRAVEYELANNASRRAQFPGGFEQVLAAAFAHYQAAGGTETSASAVAPVANPCPPPTLNVPARSLPADASQRSPVGATQTIPARPR